MININQKDFSNSPASGKRPSYSYGPKEILPPAIVSVITPFFNTVDIFHETATSLFNQSFQNWEWIIVDDGSTDQLALNQLADVAKQDSRITVIWQENAGPSAARNTAFKNSIGTYICLLDSDDLLEPTYIEKCIWFLESQPEFAFCNSWSVTFGDENFLWTAGFERGKNHIDANSGPPISVIRRKAFETVKGFNETIRKGHEDWDFWLALAKKGLWGYTLQEYLEWYRRSLKGRFCQIMSEPAVNHEFEQYIHDTYDDIRSSFPDPKLKFPQPYEDINTHIPFSNLLDKPDSVKRILFLLPWMVTGGADKVNLDWVRGLSENGYQVTICTTLQSHNDWLPEFAKITSDIFDLTKFLHQSDVPRFLNYLIGSRQIDIVLISGSTMGYHLLPYLRSSCPSVTFVDLCHVEEPHWLNGGHPRFGAGYQEMLDLNIVTTSHLRDWMTDRGSDPERIKVCYTGINTKSIHNISQRRDDIRKELGITSDLPVIVFAGRICRQKRPQLLAEILQRLVAEKTIFKCFIIGEGELKPLLSKLITDFSIGPYVEMLGTVGHARWLELLAAADIFLMPSEYEGISVALYESLAMDNVVPVMSNVGGQSEIIDSDCGYLIPQDDNELQRYVSAIDYLIKNPSARREISRNGVIRVNTHYTHHDTILKLLEIFRIADANFKQAPRPTLQRGFALEMANMAIEYKRLSSVADVLWSQSRPNATTSQPAVDLTGVFNLLTLISRTGIGSSILKSNTLCRIGQWLYDKLQSHQQ
jgi:glycosyltransferase involved in cell wall biosynthesis